MGAVTAVILGRTYVGRAMYAIGGNEEAARLSGISVTRQKLIIYALSGVFAAVAGIVLASRLASAQPQAAARLRAGRHRGGRHRRRQPVRRRRQGAPAP